jgi:transposase
MTYKKNEEKMKQIQAKIDEIKTKYELISPHLNERSKRLFAASEALALGYKGITLVSKATGLSRPTITTGCKELELKQELEVEKTRHKGGGRKTIEEKYPDIMDALAQMIDSTTFGDPEKPLQWTCKSQRNLTEELNEKGYKVSHVTVGTLLEHLGYSLQSNKKSIEGSENVDRNAQFEFINSKVVSFQKQGLPVISVDTKKKELVGNYKNSGKAYHPKKEPVLVKVYDFVDKELGKVNPYGEYDFGSNIGWVSLGTDHDTAQFAVESIRRWFDKIGKVTYPSADKLDFLRN